MAIKFRKEQILIIDIKSCPKEIQAVLNRDYYYELKDSNKIIFTSNLKDICTENSKLSEILQKENLVSYYEDSKLNFNYEYNFERSITDFCLEVEEWLINQKFDLTNIAMIMFEV